ncbi:MAG TPA: NYN domain-containing protein [Candidatus Uhrbacteria bacterium]|nr:NYN domain-containing protein [Candidatus Uhrbacteria bacterium]
MIKHKEQRIGVFVDVQNMYHSAKNLYKANVNFQEVLKTAIAGRKLIRAVAYGIITTGGEESKFLETLEKQGFEVKTKELQIFPGGAKKGDWDVGLAVDAIKTADKLDVIILVTGDGDFIPLVRYLQENKGCLVELVSFAKSTSSKLLEVVDDYTDLGSNISKYLLKSGLKRRR